MQSLKSTRVLLFLFFSTFFTLLHADEVTFSYVPKKVYQKQIFPISFLVTSSSQAENISFTFSGNKYPVLKNPEIIHNDDNQEKTFYTFYFKTTEKVFKIPEINININGTNSILRDVKIPVKKLPSAKNFSGVMASGLKIKNHQVSTFDDKSNLIAISIEAHDANLEDIYIPSALKDGTENAKRTGSKMEIHYYIVLPSKDKKLTFSYFDTIKETFVEKTLSIEVHDGSVAAQTDLNPKDDSFEALKKFTLTFLTILFMLLFFWKKDFFYLIIAVISAAILLTFYTALSTVCVKEGSPLYIVPTQTSTTSIHIDTQLKTTKLAEHNDFVKIKNTNGTIGWIKNEDLCEN
jgi:hypothetical protein